MLLDTIRVMKLNKKVDKLGKKLSIIFILTELKREMKEDIVLVTKAKTPTLSVHVTGVRSKFFKLFKGCIRLKIEKT